MYTWQCSLMPEDFVITLEHDNGEKRTIRLSGLTSGETFSEHDLTPTKKEQLGKSLNTDLKRARRYFRIKIPVRLLWHMSHTIEVLHERDLCPLSRSLDVELTALVNRRDQSLGIAYVLEALIDSSRNLGAMLNRQSARLSFSVAAGSNDQTEIKLSWDHPTEDPVCSSVFTARTHRLTPTPQPV